MEVPLPQPPAYHRHAAPVPSEPPLSVRVLDWPELIDEGLADTEAAGVENVSRLTVKLAHPVVLQVPSALT